MAYYRAICVPKTLKLNIPQLFQNNTGRISATMKMKNITNLAKIKIKYYKFVTLDIKKVRNNSATKALSHKG